MFNLPKKLTGVERKKNGTLLYQGTTILPFFCAKTSIYKINKSTYNCLKLVAVVQIICLILFFSWLKNIHSPLSFNSELFLLIGCLSVAEIGQRLIDNFVKKRAIGKYEE